MLVNIVVSQNNDKAEIPEKTGTGMLRLEEISQLDNFTDLQPPEHIFNQKFNVKTNAEKELAENDPPFKLREYLLWIRLQK